MWKNNAGKTERFIQWEAHFARLHDKLISDNPYPIDSKSGVIWHDAYKRDEQVAKWPIVDMPYTDYGYHTVFGI